VRRVIADIEQAADVVGLTIAEFIPRQVIHLQQILAGFPLLGDAATWPPGAGIRASPR
jgi:arginase